MPLAFSLITITSNIALANETGDFCAKHAYSDETEKLCVQSGLQLQACVDSADTENKYSGCLEIASAKVLSPRIIYGCAGHTFGKTAFFECLKTSN